MAAQTSSSAPAVSSTTPLAVPFYVIEYRDELMFHNSASGRAANVLRAYDLPPGTTLRLYRNSDCIATAEVVVETRGGRRGDMLTMFRGNEANVFDLIEPEAQLMRGRDARFNYLYSSTIRAASLFPGDLLMVEMQLGSLIPAEKVGWSLERWLRAATLRNRRAAYDEIAEHAALITIGYLLESASSKGEDAAGEFMEEHQNTPWREALRLAIEEVGIQDPTAQTVDAMRARLSKAKIEGRRVALFMKSGRRERGQVIEIKRDHLTLRKAPGMSRYVLYFEHIHHVLFTKNK